MSILQKDRVTLKISSRGACMSEMTCTLPQKIDACLNGICICLILAEGRTSRSVPAAAAGARVNETKFDCFSRSQVSLARYLKQKEPLIW